MMATKVLQEGILDVKIPRGSENRKLWKAWRRQWIGFSVVYPSGRREPYLTLELSRSPTKIPGSPIRICRDGLRLFRCRSKSRPYRTWAIMSGSKPLLFFAAETEIRAQEWMQSVRDGLWPPCFSFQMLTACSYEISLIDDDNTFRSGLLGVYGRMVLTSEDVLSVMHPHWGATLLQISLGSVQDVRLVRYAEIPPAGVFCIELKEAENSNARTFTFYSSTATDAMQWILSKMFTKAIEEHSKFSRNKTSSKNNKNSENLSTSVLSLPYTTDENASNLLIDIIDTESEYEIPISLSNNFVRNGGLQQECASLNSAVNFADDVKVTSKQTLTQSKEILADEGIISSRKPVSKTGVLNPSPSRDTFSESSSYGEVITSKSVPEKTTYEIQDPFLNFDINEYANTNDLNKNDAHKTNVSFLKSPNNACKSTEYATVNKRHNSKEAGQSEWKDNYKETETRKSNLSTCDNNLDSKKVISLDIPCLNSNYLSTFEHETPNLSELNYICGKITTPPILDDDTGKDQTNTKSSDIDSNLKIKNPSLVASDTWNFETYGKVNKQFMSKDFTNHTLNSEPPTKETLSFKNSEINHSFYLPNITSDLLDTSINSRILKSKNERWSLENNAEFLPIGISDECNDLEFTSNIYEHLLERKGTVYEEIDESDEEFELQLPPELPKRPSKLEIPDSLRLQKLSASINETLKVMKTSSSQSVQYSRPNFVKKIKEIGRIMHVGPSQEIVGDEQNFMKTLQEDNKNIGILKPSVKNVEIQAEAISKSCITDTSLQLSIKHQQSFI